jgi:hypothetical protein
MYSNITFEGYTSQYHIQNAVKQSDNEQTDLTYNRTLVDTLNGFWTSILSPRNFSQQQNFGDNSTVLYSQIPINAAPENSLNCGEQYGFPLYPSPMDISLPFVTNLSMTPSVTYGNEGTTRKQFMKSSMIPPSFYGMSPMQKHKTNFQLANDMNLESNSNYKTHQWNYTVSKPYKTKFWTWGLTMSQKNIVNKVMTSNNMQYLVQLKPYDYMIKEKKSITTGKTTFLYVCKHRGGCSREFERSYNLLDHCRMHVGIRPHQCHICLKSFTQKGNLNKHLTTHTH